MVGKGQFECGSKLCKEKENLRSWELNFGYVEHDEKKNALVKLSMLQSGLKNKESVPNLCLYKTYFSLLRTLPRMHDKA